MAARRATLSTLRALLRHARTAHVGSMIDLLPAAGAAAAVASPPPAPPPLLRSAAAAPAELRARDGWRSVVLAHFRAGAALRPRSAEAASARRAASDVLAYVRTGAEAAALRAAYRGADVDAPEQRRSVARFIGFEMPAAAPGPAAEGAAAAAAAARVGDKYRASVAARAAAGETKLTGLDAIKAQLYGVR